MKQLLLSALAIGFLATSCSTTTDPADGGGDGTYIPSTAGSYVIHSNLERSIDTNGVITDNELPDDSTVVAGTINITDDSGVSKNAVQHFVYIEGAAVDTIYLAEEGSKIYMYLELGAGDAAPGDINLGTQWVLWADSEGTSWTSLEQNFPGFEIEFQGQEIPADISIKVTGENVGKGSMLIDGTSVPVAQYEQTFVMSISMAVLPPPLPPLVIPIEFVTQTWIGEGVGIVSQRQDPDVLEVPLVGMKIPIDGFESEAIRYSIK